jgi:hypothetical protein
LVSFHAFSALVFTKGAKTLDMAVISYILNSPAARAQLAKVEPVRELGRRKLKIYVSPSISSSDVIKFKAYRKTSSPYFPKRASRKIPPPPPARPAQVVVDTCTAFYEQHDAYPAAHNAVVQTMTPAMRQRLRARRIRGGASSNTLMGKLTIGSYFAVWYALNVVYNSKFVPREFSFEVALSLGDFLHQCVPYRTYLQLSTRRC